MCQKGRETEAIGCVSNRYYLSENHGCLGTYAHEGLPFATRKRWRPVAPFTNMV